MSPLRRLQGVPAACNSTDTCNTSSSEEVWSTLMAVYLGTILMLSVVFNGTICLVFYKKPHLLSISNCFVLNLSCCQLGMTLFVQPFSLFAVVSRDMVYSGAWCYIHGYLFTVFVVTIQISLLMISLDRNYAIMNSLRYPYICTQSLCNVLIGLSWLFGLIMAIPPLAGSGLGRYNYQRHMYICSLDWTSGHAYLGIFSSVAFLVPILIQGCCYLKIFMAALGHSKRSRRVHPWVTQSSSKFQDGPSESSESSDSINSSLGSTRTTECKAVRTIFLIAISYCVCWVPYFTDAYLLLKTQETISSLRAAAMCLVFTTSVLNPVIYAYMNRVTRREIGRFLCGHPVQPETDDFISTSMSTFSAPKQVSAGWPLPERHRSRSTGGIFSNEMDTILEETEENCCETRSEGSYPLPETNIHAPAHSTHSDPLSKFPSCQKDTKTNAVENAHINKEYSAKRNSLVNVNENILKNKQKECTKLKIGKTKGESLWNIVRMSKGRRRRSKDCGSFLYFQNDNKVKSKLKALSRVTSRSEMSVDHKISVAELPDRLKFRLSVSDLETSKRALTLNSKVEIKNRTVDNMSQCGASTSRDDISTSNVIADIHVRNQDKNKWHRSKSFMVTKEAKMFDCQSTYSDITPL